MKANSAEHGLSGDIWDNLPLPALDSQDAPKRLETHNPATLSREQMFEHIGMALEKIILLAHTKNKHENIRINFRNHLHYGHIIIYQSKPAIIFSCSDNPKGPVPYPMTRECSITMKLQSREGRQPHVQYVINDSYDWELPSEGPSEPTKIHCFSWTDGHYLHFNGNPSPIEKPITKELLEEIQHFFDDVQKKLFTSHTAYAVIEDTKIWVGDWLGKSNVVSLPREIRGRGSI